MPTQEKDEHFSQKKRMRRGIQSISKINQNYTKTQNQLLINCLGHIW
jgi:hypothetical protein